MTQNLSPKKFREIVLQILYAMQSGDLERDDLISLIMSELKVSRGQTLLAYEIASLTFEKRLELDEKIATHSASYNFERIGIVEKNILRLGFRDLIENLLPHPVIIAESVRLARKFATDSSATYVQALLNAFIGKKDETPLQAC